MLKKDKKIAVKELKHVFSSYSSIIVFHYKGLSVSDINFLRKELLKCDAKIKVVKNTLASIALKENNSVDMVDLFKGPSAIAWSNEPITLSKVLHTFSKKNNNLVIVGGVYEGTKLNKNTIISLANMPSLNELKSKLVAIIKTPATNIAVLLQKPASLLVAVLNEYSKSREINLRRENV